MKFLPMYDMPLNRLVAPFVGAGIEILTRLKLKPAFWVAPFVGAGIEITLQYVFRYFVGSHPSWVRGLKSMRSRGY